MRRRSSTWAQASVNGQLKVRDDLLVATDLVCAFTDTGWPVGDAVPSAKITGIDLSPIQPVWLPPNVEFIVDDIEDEWADASDFDYVHSRVVFSCLRDPPNVINTAFR